MTKDAPPPYEECVTINSLCYSVITDDGDDDIDGEIIDERLI